MADSLDDAAPPAPPTTPDIVSRRTLLAGAAGAVGGALIAKVTDAAAQGAAAKPAPAAQATPPTAALVAPDDPTKVPGVPTSAVGFRSPFVTPARTPTGELAGTSLSPLQDLAGTITPADLHFERHHAGIPIIDPARHTLIIHGLVERPSVFTLDDLKRFPFVSRVHFVECAGNGRPTFRDAKNEAVTPQRAAGMSSNSEWIGVPLRVLFDEVGAKPEAAWFLAEGGDASVMTRSIPMAKAFDDALIVYAQNGEPLRPAQGYPMRLLLPGWEGNTNVKWLRRLQLGTEPWMTRWETSKYTDPLASGTARQFSFEMDARSIITAPAFPRTMAPGWSVISGLAWSGRGKIRRVEVSSDGGNTWTDAHLHEPVLSKAYTRFSLPFKWDGTAAMLLSRATDETGYVQPTRERLVAVRGAGTDYHLNHIVGWKVAPDGKVTFHGET